jgi:hypothetical protein
MTQVAFLHIHKCGGSTIRHMLNTVYPYAVQYPAPLDFQSNNAPYRTQKFDVPHIYEQLKNTDTSEFQLFMGHYDWQLVQQLDNDAIVLTMLRNPIDQLYSMFRYFWVDTRHYGHYKDRYQASGFEGFLHEVYVNQFVNHQTRFLSGRYYGYSENDLSNGVLTNAKRNLKKSVYGLTERWDESMQLFEAAIGKPLPVGLVQNFNSVHRADTLSHRAIEKARELQRYDISLYEYALEHFEEQF